MVSCAVKSCKIYSGKKGVKERNITHHKFPDHLLLKEKWRAACRRPGWTPTHQSKVCSRHFTADSFKVSKKGWRRLHEDAVPTLFLRSPEDDDFEEPGPKRSRSNTGAGGGGGASERRPAGGTESQSGEFRARAGPAAPAAPAAAGRVHTEARSFTLDRELLADLHELSDKIQHVYPVLRGKSFTVAFKGADGDKCEYVFTSASQSRRAGEAHSGLSCDECRTAIAGFRYKCVSCPDYDLCGACEALGVHDQHMMMRISRPLKFRHARSLVQRWCEAMKSAGISSPDALMSDPPCAPTPAPPPAPALARPPSAAPHGDTAAVDTDRRDDSDPDDPDVDFEVMTSHQPLTLKRDPFEVNHKAAKPTDKPYKDKSSKTTRSTKAAKMAKKRAKDDGTKTTIASMERRKEREKSEAAGGRKPSMANYYGTFGETDPALSVDDVKMEEEDPLSSSEITHERQLKSIEDNLGHILSARSDSNRSGADRHIPPAAGPPGSPGSPGQCDSLLDPHEGSYGPKWT